MTDLHDLLGVPKHKPSVTYRCPQCGGTEANLTAIVRAKRGGGFEVLELEWGDGNPLCARCGRAMDTEENGEPFANPELLDEPD